MKNLGYYNGEFGPLEEMKIPMNDRVCFFGDGVYEATSAGNHHIFLLDEHVDRFFKSAEMLRIPLSFDKEELKYELNRMLDLVEGDRLSVYWQQTRGTANRDHAFPDAESNLWIMIRQAKFRDLRERIDLTSIEDTRFLHCNIKTLNLIPSVMAAEKAKEEGCMECVFHRGDIVTEGAHSNISILKNGVFKTHPNDQYILPGISKHHLILACNALGIPVDETPFTLDELRNADEIIVSSSSNFCMIAKSFEGQAVGGKDTERVNAIQQYVINEYNTYCQGVFYH